MQRFHRIPVVLLSVLILCGGPAAKADTAPALPPPTGPYPVGRITYHWTDSARADILAPNPAARRELVVDVWYPAQAATGQTAADYLPDFAALQRAVGDAGLRAEFGPAYEALMAGRVRTHSVENAPFARRLGRCPVLIFSHGFGVLSRTYTAQLEDLASQGYVVAAIAHTYETMATVFPDGRAVPFASEPWKASRTTEESSMAYQDDRMKSWAADIRFVLDELKREDRRRPGRAPFAGHLDLRRVGAFGHSAGGRAAALACRNDPRMRACLNEDGLARFSPFDRAAIRRLEQPFLLFVAQPPPTPPTDEELAQMGLTRSAAEALIKQLHAEQDAAMESTGRGSYRVTLAMPGISHSSFSDRPLLQAVDDPDKRQEAVRNLQTIRAYTLAFFDKSLRGARNTMLDRMQTDATIKVEPFS
jgi:predicted dienelactone hydrolase